jgi:hypothetical protein
MFSAMHSRFMARQCSGHFSLLCPVDKLAIALEPWWLYLPRVMATGEIKEYMAIRNDPNSKYGREASRGVVTSRREWHRGMAGHCQTWAYLHKDGGPDTVTGKRTNL